MFDGRYVYGLVQQGWQVSGRRLFDIRKMVGVEIREMVGAEIRKMVGVEDPEPWTCSPWLAFIELVFTERFDNCVSKLLMSAFEPVRSSSNLGAEERLLSTPLYSSIRYKLCPISLQAVLYKI